MSTYASKATIVSLLSQINPSVPFTESDLPDIVWHGSADIIDAKADTSFNAFTGDLYVDGQAENFIFCPRVPILTLTALKRINTDTTTVSYVVSGTSREVWFNEETGLIQLINDEETGIEYGPPATSPVFPRGVKNIKITGSFGDTSVTNILYLLQSLLCLQALNKLGYEKFSKLDMLEEAIGEYRYKIQDSQYAKDAANQKLTLEGYIDYLFKLLPKEDSYRLLGV